MVGIKALLPPPCVIVNVCIFHHCIKHHEEPTQFSRAFAALLTVPYRLQETMNYEAARSNESVENNIEKQEPPLTLDEHRRAALAEVDNAKFSWFHVRVCIIAGIGSVYLSVRCSSSDLTAFISFFTDAYDIFAVSPYMRICTPFRLSPR